ncbi:hypothetical protein PCASD_19107 [Puccinia coronata f. sp. avenae]|uniref:Uncharacterized protein n=1 Tax=Puccinia coronata f. sp. avenae TaxID=200324 RepID=A0A2N5U1G7_9BASI|nr:hypothetical protein PCASD_19107 [Puccinia coronata f. sp. avenae]
MCIWNIPTLHLDTYQTPTTSPVDNILIKDKGALQYQHPSDIILISHQSPHLFLQRVSAPHLFYLGTLNHWYSK